jgi:excisionase family DNA binding protein
MEGKQNNVDFLTVDEAALLVGLSHWTLRSWLHKGLLTKYKSGSRTVISRTELLALVEPQEIAPANESARQMGAALPPAAPLPKGKEKP